MKYERMLSRTFFYTFFVFFSIWLVLILRSASLIWIYHTFMGYDHWEPFIRSIRNNLFIAFIQSLVLLPAIIIFLRKQALFSLRIMAITLFPLYILNLFIEPIGIWTMSYNWGAVLTNGTVILFPLSVYLLLFFILVRYKSNITRILQNISL